MIGSLTEDIRADFFIELKDYIPTLRDKVSRLSDSGPIANHEDLTEIHRLVHTIKGASSLVKLTNLSHVAGQLEDVIEAAMHRQLEVSDTVADTIHLTLDYLDAYCNEANHANVDEQSQQSQISRALQHVLSRVKPPPRASGSPHRIDGSSAGTDPDHHGMEELPLEDMELENCDVAVDAAWMDHADDAGDDCNDPTIGACQDTAVEAIELPEAELLEGFFQEAEDHFQDLGGALEKLETEIVSPATLTAAHKELLRQIRRSVHTIKGAAAIIQLKTVASWGHAFEDLLDWLYETAVHISPEVVRVVAESADVLEQIVASPDEIDSAKTAHLRAKFQHIMDRGEPDDSRSDAEPQDDLNDDTDQDSAVEAIDRPQAERLDDFFQEAEDHFHDLGGALEEKASTPGNESVQDPESDDLAATQTTPSALRNPTKTIRVDMAKVEALVGLTSELIVALSAFDQNMAGMGNAIGELDRSRIRLNGTARNLEVGYEVKAIQHLGAHQPIANAPVSAPVDGSGAFSEFDLLELDRYSEFNLIIRSLNETSVDVNTIGTQLTGIHGDFESSLNRLRILLGELQDKVMRVRMTPMATIANRLRRTVRETARQLDKDIHFTIQGEDIELDKMVWEKLADPLMHLLRNAVDHGIETTAQRKKLGKPVPAGIHLSAEYQGDQVVIRVMDDGSGIDLNAIRHVTASCALVPDAAAMTDEALADMIFRPGFSTRMDISEVSGRGVGMDVVKENIHALKGRIHIEASEKAIGTTFQIRIPLTLAVLRALMFSIGGRIYATSLYEIKEILRIDPKNIRKGEDNSKTIQWDNRPIPFYQLSDHVPVGDADTQRKDTIEHPLVLIIDTGSWQGAVAIDQMHGQKDIVVKHLGAHLNHVTGIAGAAVLGDGRIVPILNLEELLMARHAQEHRPAWQPSQPIGKSLNILVVDDSVSVRTVVSRLMQRQGWEVQTAKDGVEALECLHTYRPDLIVLDIEMPRMNGYEFMAAFRARKAFGDIPVIMLTSRAARKHREKAKAVGVNGFLIKPYEDQDFIALIRRLTAPRKKVIPFHPKRPRKPSDA